LATKEVRYSFKSKKPGKTKAFFICLLISGFLWLVHALNTVYNYSLRIPVSYHNLPHNKKPVMQLPDQLNVDIKASGLKILLILFNKPFNSLNIDFRTLKRTNRNSNFILTPQSLNLKKVFRFETQVRHITPDTLYFSDKTGFQKTVPVRVPIFIKCAVGYGYTRPAVNPSFVTIWGDSSLVKKTDTVYTQPVTGTNVSKSIIETVSLIRPDENVYISANDATVHIDVSRLIEYTLNVPIKDVASEGKSFVNIYPRTASIRFTAVQNSFQPSDTAQFRVLINSNRVNKKTNKCAVYLGSAPGHVTVMDIEPQFAEILILK
jgi:hypothetical protein